MHVATHTPAHKKSPRKSRVRGGLRTTHFPGAIGRCGSTSMCAVPFAVLCAQDAVPASMPATPPRSPQNAHSVTARSIPMQTLHQQPQGCLSLKSATSATQAWRERYATRKNGSSLIFLKRNAAFCTANPAPWHRSVLAANHPGTESPWLPSSASRPANRPAQKRRGQN